VEGEQNQYIESKQMQPIGRMDYIFSSNRRNRGQMIPSEKLIALSGEGLPLENSRMHQSYYK